MPTIHSILTSEPIEASAPCRIDMGGTLDLSTFFLPLNSLKPCTFNAALDLRTKVRISPFDPGRTKISSRGFESLVVDSDKAPFNPPLGLILAVAAYFQAEGVHIEIESASPPRSALGGSSVAAVALIWAFYKALAKTGVELPSFEQVAVLAHAIEQSVAGVPCGMQDQLAAVFGGVNAWHWNADSAGPMFKRETLIPVDRCPSFDRRLIVAYCGIPHVSKDINGTWVRQFISGETRSVWLRILECSQKFIACVAAGDYSQAQHMMNVETDLRCQLTPEVLDDLGMALVMAAREHTCAARFTGAGGGGCLWALGEPEQIIHLKKVWGRILAGRESAEILDTHVDPQGLI